MWSRHPRQESLPVLASPPSRLSARFRRRAKMKPATPSIGEHQHAGSVILCHVTQEPVQPGKERKADVLYHGTEPECRPDPVLLHDQRDGRPHCRRHHHKMPLPRTIMGKNGRNHRKTHARERPGIINADPRSIIEALLPNRSTSLPKKGASAMEAKMIMVVVPPAVVNIWKIL